MHEERNCVFSQPQRPRWQYICAGGYALALVCLIGCKTPQPPVPQPVAQPIAPIIVVTQIVNPAVTVAKPPSSVVKVEKPLSPVIISTETKLLHVSLAAKAAANGDANVVASRVRDAVAGDLAPKYAISSTLPDFVVDLVVASEVFDHSGEFRVYKGEVKSSVTRVGDNRLLGRTTTALKGKRELGAADALRSLAGLLSKDTSAWVAKTIEPFAKDLEAVEVTLQSPWPRQQLTQAEYAALFVNELKALGGVIACESLDKNKLVFRVVYSKDRLPTGVIDRLIKVEKLELKAR